MLIQILTNVIKIIRLNNMKEFKFYSKTFTLSFAKQMALRICQEKCLMLYQITVTVFHKEWTKYLSFNYTIYLPVCITNKNIEATCRRVRRIRSKYVVGVIEGLTKFIQSVQVVIASHTWKHHMYVSLTRHFKLS